MFRHVLEKVVAGKNLEAQEMEHTLDEILAGDVPSTQVAGFLTGLRSKGETAQEIASAARVLRRKASPGPRPRGLLVDTCGTGGDRSGTFNISTTVAFVVAGSGIPVAKHGNRSVSSACGSADVLEELGVPFPTTPADAEHCLDQASMAFLFAPAYHAAMGQVAGIRRELGIRTLFNILGPLINPAPVTHHVLGVCDPTFLSVLGNALGDLGLEGGLVVHGAGGLDEFSLQGPNAFVIVQGRQLHRSTVSPEDAGLPRAPREALAGGNAADNARIVKRILAGERGPQRDVTLFNAAAVFLVTGRAFTWKEGVRQAAESIDSGKAHRVLDTLQRCGKEETL